MTLAVLVFSLAACSGSSGSSDRRPDDGNPPPDPLPSLSFSAAPTTVPAGGNTTLTWSSEDATACDASGGWNGSRSTSGSRSVGPIEQDTVFRLSCSGPGGGATAQVNVRVAAQDDVAVELAASPPRIGINDSATLTWSSQGASACSASGGWSGSRPLSGTYQTGPLAESTSYSLSCRDGPENALASVTVEVLDKTIRWQAPTQNEDGTPITDLAGYVVYWGTQSRNYIGSHRIESSSVTEWEADIAPGTYYFALTAFDSQGNESDYSNELLKDIP